MKKTEIVEIIKSIEKKYNVLLINLFKDTQNDCNQCHDNCNDCGWDR